MALIRDDYCLNWPVGKGAGKDGKAGKLWRVEIVKRRVVRHERNRLRERVRDR